MLPKSIPFQLTFCTLHSGSQPGGLSCEVTDGCWHRTPAPHRVNGAERTDLSLNRRPNSRSALMLIRRAAAQREQTGSCRSERWTEAPPSHRAATAAQRTFWKIGHGSDRPALAQFLECLWSLSDWFSLCRPTDRPDTADSVNL